MRELETDEYEGHTEGQWALEEREDDEGHQWFEVPAVSYTTKMSGDGSQQEFADAKLIADAPLLLAEVKRLRKDRDLLWDAIRLSGTGGHQEEEIAFWHEKLLNMNEAELKEAFKGHYEDD